MISKRDRAFLVAALALAGLAAMPPARAIAGGPISDMIGRYKMQRQMKLPPMDKPFTIKKVKDPNVPGLAGRFKQRFAVAKPTGTSIMSKGGLFGAKSDSGLTRASR